MKKMMNDSEFYLVPASRTRRLIAFGFDFIILGVFGVSISSLFFSKDLAKNHLVDSPILGLGYFLFLYSAFFIRDFWHGRGPGKRILNLVVLNEDKKELKVSHHLIRNLGLFFWPLDFVFVFGKEKKRLMELPVNSRVFSFGESPCNIRLLVLWNAVIVLICTGVKFFIRTFGA